MGWKPGCKSPNKSGRPKGTLNKRTQLGKLLEPHAPALINKCVELALAGDTNALRLAMERLIPRAKDEPVPFELPKGKLSPDSLKEIVEGILRSLERSEITPEQAKSMFDVVKGYRDNVVVEEILMQATHLQDQVKKYFEKSNTQHMPVIQKDNKS